MKFARAALEVELGIARGLTLGWVALAVFATQVPHTGGPMFGPDPGDFTAPFVALGLGMLFIGWAWIGAILRGTELPGRSRRARAQADDGGQERIAPPQPKGG